MIEQRLPVIARWMLFALGTVEGKRIHRPVDAVAAWLLKQQPTLLPTIPQSALLTTIRARTDIVDRLLADEFYFARQANEQVITWSFGGGFDARWFRVLPHHADVVVEHREVESPQILELKGRLLNESPYVDAWKQVMLRPLAETHWTVTPRKNARPIVILETGAGRMEDELLRATLLRIRKDAPDARIIVGLPAVSGPQDRRWSNRSLAQLGWRVAEDVHMGTRGRLLAHGGAEVCPGMYAFRVVRLLACEPLQA